MILDDIVRRKREEIRAIQPIDPDKLGKTSRNFAAALGAGRSTVSIIAEVKQASPSAGLLTGDFDPISIALAYAEGGAAAISVLTDVDFFRGSLEDLRGVAKSVELPVLRKDFVIDERQIYEARAAGADSVLLIAAILDRKTLQRFLAEARALGMEPLVEIHDERERDQALEAGARVVGINNRDLNTFRIDVETTLRLVPGLPDKIVVVSESGVESEAGVARLIGYADAALIGTALMRASDRSELLSRLVSAGGRPGTSGQ
ncbi:MAG: indole-3-glycerol phosphate synthase TrpC [Candidatus Eisenbacteria bacterium]|nr:indole-3-glycerol phosphate synthase TrpC [Candidatus Eisenbacteria bacterium]